MTLLVEPDMTPGLPARQGPISGRFQGQGPEVPCAACGLPTTSRFGICRRTPDCRAYYARRRTNGVITPPPPVIRCKVCGEPTKSKYRICRRSPQCLAARQNMRRTGLAPPLPAWVNCQVCGQPTRAKYGICSRTTACHAAHANAAYQENPGQGISATRAWQLRNPEKVLLRNARSRARAQGIPFALNVGDIVIPETCPVLGMKLSSSTSGNAPNSPTLDRRVPAAGYVPGNIWVISYRANRMKSDASPEELRSFSRAFLNFGLEDQL